jgi:N-hydroxyarylamine O-acetyltransferase
MAADQNTPPGSVDLPAYLDRIGWRGGLHPTLETLAGLHLAHTSSIPFENLDIQLGRGIRLDLASLQAKLVRGRRGGYCFEQNSLFAAVLRELGFQLTLREARVRRGSSALLPRTHLTLEVRLEGASWLADVGFGSDGIPGPVPLDGREQPRFGGRHRVVPEGTRQVLQTLTAQGWADVYALEPSEVLACDLEMANHYTSTHPDSRFVQTLTVQRYSATERCFLRNLTFSVVRADGTETRELAPEDLLPLLRERFGLDFPPGTRFRALERLQA